MVHECDSIPFVLVGVRDFLTLTLEPFDLISSNTVFSRLAEASSTTSAKKPNSCHRLFRIFIGFHRHLISELVVHSMGEKLKIVFECG
jgi:hypothetical protein